MKNKTKLLLPWRYSLKKTVFLMTMFLGISFGWQANAQSYCIPSYSEGCSGGDQISNITLEGDSVTLNNESGCSPDAYGDYTDLTPPDLSPGNYYTLVVTSDYASPQFEEVRAWIDYNGDGTFDSSEQIASTQFGLPENGTEEFIFTVPSSVENGEYRMRVKMNYNNNDIQPCGDGEYGETEDYTVFIGTMEACAEATAGTLLTEDTSICAGESFTLEVEGDSNPADGLTKQWMSSTDDQDWEEVEGATSSSYTVTDGITEETQYKFVVTCSADDSIDETETVTISLNPANECECESPSDIVVTDITNATADVSWTAGADETQWNVVYGEEGFNLITEGESIVADQNNVTLTDLDAATTYDVYVRAICGDEYSDEVGPETFTTEEESNSYCEGDDFEMQFGGIDSFTTTNAIENIDNQNITQTNGYSDFTDMVVSQEAGESFDFSVQIVDNWAIWEAAVAIYIDYNNDFEFDSSEMVYASTGYITETTGTITIPEGTNPGNYRLRVVSDHLELSPGACEAQSAIQDYTLTVSGQISDDCEAPTDLSVDVLSPTLAQVNWSGNADDYEIAWGVSPYQPGDEGGSQFTTGDTNSYSIGVESDTEYDVYVRAICGDEYSAWIDASFTTPEGDDCQAPSGITIDNITANGAEITWSPANEGDDQWEISFVTGGQTPDEGTTEVVSGTPSYTATNLDPDTAYSVYLKTICSDEVSSVWAYNGFFQTLEGTGPVVCEAPTDVNVANITETSAEVSWTAGGFENQWEVLYGESGFNPSSEGESVTVEVVLLYNLSELDPETEYDVYVRSVCDEDNFSDWTGPETFITEGETVEECEAPTAIEVTDITETTAVVTWTPQGDELSWAVIYGESGFSQEDEDEFVTDIVLAPTHTLAELTPETDYDVYVYAICDEDEMIYSDQVGPISFITDELSVDSQEFNNFTFYPNPVENQLSLKAGTQIENVQVYNLIGQNVLSLQPNSLEAQINTEVLQSGVYLMKVSINGSQKTFRVVKK